MGEVIQLFPIQPQFPFYNAEMQLYIHRNALIIAETLENYEDLREPFTTGKLGLNTLAYAVNAFRQKKQKEEENDNDS